MSIIFLFPTNRPVTADTMNYAIVFLAAVLVAAMVYWYVGGKRWYTGPLVEAELLQDSDSGREGGLDSEKPGLPGEEPRKQV